jgi:hypothetical protein
VAPEPVAAKRSDDFHHAAQKARQQTGLPSHQLDPLRKSLNPLSRFDFGVLAALAYSKQWQAKERKDYAALLEQVKQEEIAVLKERQALQRQEQQYKHEEEKERYVSEHHDAKRMRAELEQERLKQEELDRNDNLREGPPPPRMGK